MGYHPQRANPLKEIQKLTFDVKGVTSSLADADEIKGRFPNLFGSPILQGKEGDAVEFAPLKIGVVFSGGQASGGHNVIAGLFDSIKELNSSSTLIGFLDGPSGIVDGVHRELGAKELAEFRNQGGFDLLGSGRTKIETDTQLERSLKTVQELSLDGLVVIGGDDSNTNAAVLAEYFKSHGCETKVVGVPKTIDGDLQNEHVEISFGFDTACKVYSEMIGNICRDALSAKKYYHFIKLMGRSASHIALECAFQTQPNLTLIGEEVEKNNTTLAELKDQLIALIKERSAKGKNFGVILIPEGLIEFIPEMKRLIGELNTLIAGSGDPVPKLSSESKATFKILPKEIQQQILMDRDPHGNVQVSHIRTERLLIELIKDEVSISPVEHFFGYEGRCALPSNFDACYCYNLGLLAASLLASGHSGYMCALKGLTRNVENWVPFGIPITSLLNMEERGGRPKPVIQKALVDLEGGPFKRFDRVRDNWRLGDEFHFPGPIQFYGSETLTNTHPLILSL